MHGTRASAHSPLQSGQTLFKRLCALTLALYRLGSCTHVFSFGVTARGGVLFGGIFGQDMWGSGEHGTRAIAHSPLLSGQTPFKRLCATAPGAL